MEPLLFIVYLDSLIAIKLNRTVISYADDTLLIIQDKTWDEVGGKATIWKKIFKDWLCFNKLLLSIKKLT